MSGGKAEIDRWFADPELVAAAASAGAAFGRWSRTLRLPMDFAALVVREAGDRIVIAPGEELSGEGVSELMIVRMSPLELTFAPGGLTSQDEYLCTARVHCPAAVVAERGELDSFRKTILGSGRTVRVTALTRHLEPAVVHALNALAERHQVEDLVDGKCRDEAERVIAEAVATPCFEAGLNLAGRIEVTFESEALRAVRAQQAAAAQRLDEQSAQEQVHAALAQARAQRLDELEAILKRLQTLAAGSPDAPLPQLLRAFGAAERAKLYAALFESVPVAAATQWLVVASGQELLFFAPGAFEAPARRLTLGDPIGPLRSIQIPAQPGSLADSAPRLFAGAARGVYALPVDGSAPESVYAAEAPAELRGGVNAVALWGTALYATHSELGLLRWERSAPERGTACYPELTRGAGAVRHVQTAGRRLFFSADNRIVSIDPAHEDDCRTYTGSSAVITALLATGTDVFAGNANGEILHWAGDDDAPRVLHGGSRRPAESVALLNTAGVARLVYTDTTLAVHARVLDDTIVSRYEAGGQTLQRAKVASDLIVAVDDPRYRLIVWHPNQPGRPLTTIHVARLTGRRIQDVALVPLAL